MTHIIPTAQSDIGEVRDQMSLDYADGKYLSVVTGNLGLARPPLGFSDAVWRALGRILALQYKQIETKFEEALAVILGPKITQCGALAVDAKAGDLHAELVDTSQFPQVGVMVIDEGLASAETVNYTFIDRQTNVVYFETALVHDHTAVNAQWETGVISDFGTTNAYVNVFDANGFPTTGLPYTICMGRGTAYENAGAITSVDLDNRKIGIPLPTPGGLGAGTAAGMVLAQDGGPSQQNAHYLVFQTVEAMPPTDGTLQSGPLSTTFTATAGSVTSVTVAGPLTANRYGGFWVVFEGNVTASLARKLAYVQENSTTVLTFSNTLSVAPAVGDRFTLLANFQYIRVSDADKSVLMRRELPDLLQFPANTQFTATKPQVTVAIAQVQVKGAGWDVLQSDPTHVELLLPNDLVVNDLRSASYIRDPSLSGSTTANANRALTLKDLSLTSNASMPMIGVLQHTASNTRYAYWIPHAWATADAAAGATQISVTDTSLFPASGTLRYGANTVAYTTLDALTLTTAPLPAAITTATQVFDEHMCYLNSGLTSAVTAGDAIVFYPNYSSGDIWNVADVWPGPYLWSLFEHVHKKETVVNNTATTMLSGPTYLSADRSVNDTVLEVEDASAFPTAVPYDVILGENGGNVETLAVQAIALKSRTYQTTNAAVTPADPYPYVVSMPSLSGPVGPANKFLNGSPYRVVIEPFTSNAEVLEVIGTTGGTSLLLSRPATLTHNIGSRVVLLSDLLLVNPSLSDEHVGYVSVLDRFGLYAPITQASDMVRPVYTTATLALAGTDFSATSGDALINFGRATHPVRAHIATAVASGAATLVLDSTASLPTTGYPYVICVDADAGPLRQEMLHVTNNNTGTNTLTLSHVTVFSHDVGRVVKFKPGLQETISYTSRVGSVLGFTPSLDIETTHYMMEFISPSVGTGFPGNDGFDFPLRLPVTVADRIQYMVDLVRAAGVEVTFVTQR